MSTGTDTTRKYVSVNLNQRVRFKPTRVAIDQWVAHFAAIGLPLHRIRHLVESDGMAEIQLWEFAEVFGAIAGLGRESPAENCELLIRLES